MIKPAMVAPDAATVIGWQGQKDRSSWIDARAQPATTTTP